MGLRDEEGDTEEELCTVEMPDELDRAEQAEEAVADEEEETGEAAEEPGDEAAEW